MICVSLSDPDVSTCLKQLEGVDMAEVRLDLCRFTPSDIKKIFIQNLPMIATHRDNGASDEERFKLMKAAIDAGARYIDLEIEADDRLRRSLFDYARNNRCEVIISYHNFETTPGLAELESILNVCFSLGANIAKIATQVNDKHQLATLLGLYRHKKRLVILGMGNNARLSRIIAPLLGGEFTFAAPDTGKTTAPGQLSVSELRSIIDELKLK